MPQCRKVSAHPAHLGILHNLVNRGEAQTIDALFRAKRVMDAIEKSVNPDGAHPEPNWVDPSKVRTKADWDAVREQKGPDGKPIAGDSARWDPAARIELVLSQDEFDHAVKCFERGVARAIGGDARSLIDLKEALDESQQVTV